MYLRRIIKINKIRLFLLFFVSKDILSYTIYEQNIQDHRDTGPLICIKPLLNIFHVPVLSSGASLAYANNVKV